MIPLTNIPLTPFAASAPLPVSAVSGRVSAANALPQPSGVRTSRNFALPQQRIDAIRAGLRTARPIGFLTRLISESQAHTSHTAAAARLQESVSHLLQRAEHEEWSQRELARRVGISERTFRRMRSGQVDALAWLPRIQPAVQRLSPG